MDKKIRKLILEFLYDKKKTVTDYDIKQYCLSKYEIPEKDFTQRDEIEQQINHIKHVLLGENIIENGEGEISHFIWLTAKGYKEFDPWYKKFWDFINNDFAKLLSLISIILSIIATYLSLSK